MRDDIHKSAPLPAAWKRVVKRCQRDADWSTASALVRRALAQQIRAELSPGFLHALVADCASPQPGLFPGDALIAAGAAAGGPLERRVVAHARLLIATGVPGEAVATQALQRMLVESVHARMLQLDAHARAKSRRDAPELLRRVQQVVADSNISDLAARAASGGPLGDRMAKAPFDAEDDIRGNDQ